MVDGHGGEGEGDDEMTTTSTTIIAECHEEKIDDVAGAVFAGIGNLVKDSSSSSSSSSAETNVDEEKPTNETDLEAATTNDVAAVHSEPPTIESKDESFAEEVGTESRDHATQEAPASSAADAASTAEQLEAAPSTISDVSAPLPTESSSASTSSLSSTEPTSSPMKRKRSTGASGDEEGGVEEEEDEPPMKRNSPDMGDVEMEAGQEQEAAVAKAGAEDDAQSAAGAEGTTSETLTLTTEL